MSDDHHFNDLMTLVSTGFCMFRISIFFNDDGGFFSFLEQLFPFTRYFTNFLAWKVRTLVIIPLLAAHP